MALAKINLAVIVSSLAFALLFSRCMVVAMTSTTNNIQQEANVPSKDLVEQFCKQTKNHDLCVATIEADPRSGLKNDPRGFLRIIIGQALANTTTTYPLIGELLKKATDNATIECLNICDNFYKESIDFLKSATGLVDFKDKGTYNSLSHLVGRVYHDVYDCERFFAEPPAVRKSPLTSINNYLADLCQIALNIMNLIECNLTYGCN